MVLLLGVGCSHNEKVLRIAATPIPHAEILESIRPILKNKGIQLKIVEVDDYNLPNRLLFEKQVDANFFQHTPFLEEQNKQFHYNLIPLTQVHIEPLGIYSQKLKSIETIPEGAVIAIPNDPTNEARALKLLEKSGLITLKDKKGEGLTILDIQENPKKIKFEEIDAPLLPRVLPDVEASVIPANWALQAKLCPTQEALVLEQGDSPYANIIAIREEDRDRADFQVLKEAITSSSTKEFIKTRYSCTLLTPF